MVIDPDQANQEEADRVGRVARPVLPELLGQALLADLDMQVEHEQGDRHCHHAVAERLDASDAQSATRRGAGIAHGLILDERPAHAPGRGSRYRQNVAAERVDPATAREMMRAGDTIIDVRTPGEYANGHIAGAVNIPIDMLPIAVARLPDGPVI